MQKDVSSSKINKHAIILVLIYYVSEDTNVISHTTLMIPTQRETPPRNDKKALVHIHYPILHSSV